MFFENKLISIISPVYFGELVIEELVNRIHNSLREFKINYEIILVDDGSPDASWKIISDLCDKDAHLTGIRLDKNYGQHTAIKAGLDNCNGDLIVVMDCDLQDPPEEIIKLIESADEHIDVVFALRDKSWQPLLKRFYSALFYFILSILTGFRFRSNTTNFGIYKRKIIRDALSYSQRYFVLPISVRKVAKHINYIPVKFSPAIKRKSTYNFKKAFRLAMRILFSETIFYSRNKSDQQDYVISEVKKHPTT